MLELVSSTGSLAPILIDAISGMVSNRKAYNDYRYLANNNDRCTEFKFDSDLDFKNKRFRIAIEYNSYPCKKEEEV